MEIVIKIPDEVFEAYKHWDENKVATVEQTLIAHGTVLPKGHGRLIDVDVLREDFKTSKKITFAELMNISCIVDHAPTIVEADRG